MSSSGEHSTEHTRPKSDTTLTTIVRILALLICLKFHVVPRTRPGELTTKLSRAASAASAGAVG